MKPTHGSPELDADAEKLIALGMDPGPTLQDLGLIQESEARLKGYSNRCPV